MDIKNKGISNYIRALALFNPILYKNTFNEGHCIYFLNDVRKSYKVKITNTLDKKKLV